MTQPSESSCQYAYVGCPKIWFQKLEKLPLYIVNTRDSVSLRLKLAVLGQKWEENSCLRHQSISSPIDGMDSSKAVDKTLLEVSAKIEEAQSKKELAFFQRHGFWLWPRTIIKQSTLQWICNMCLEEPSATLDTQLSFNKTSLR